MAQQAEYYTKTNNDYSLSLPELKSEIVLKVVTAKEKKVIKCQN